MFWAGGFGSQGLGLCLGLFGLCVFWAEGIGCQDGVGRRGFAALEGVRLNAGGFNVNTLMGSKVNRLMLTLMCTEQFTFA